MHFQYLKPSGILSRYIKYYWVLEADVAEGEITERVIPTGNVQWMFHYREPFAIKETKQSIRQPRSFVSGISSTFADIATRGESGVIAVTFHPHGAAHFLKFPLYEIEDSNTPLDLVFNYPAKETEERICLARTLAERILILENFLYSCLHPVKDQELLLIKKGVDLIGNNAGHISPSDLSNRLFVSSKSLERKFAFYIGKTPKQFIRIIRFQKIIKDMAEKPLDSLTQIAYQSGYFDQAHFVKDFKALSGYTPGEFKALGPCNADYFE